MIIRVKPRSSKGVRVKPRKMRIKWQQACGGLTPTPEASWANKDYATIIEVAKKVAEDALQEDEKLLLWYDQALTLTEVGG